MPRCRPGRDVELAAARSAQQVEEIAAFEGDVDVALTTAGMQGGRDTRHLAVERVAVTELLVLEEFLTVVRRRQEKKGV